jgi:antitoxin VapB
MSNGKVTVLLPESVAMSHNFKQSGLDAGTALNVAVTGDIWDSWYDTDQAGVDYMSGREQPADQEREAF